MPLSDRHVLAILANFRWADENSKFKIEECPLEHIFFCCLAESFYKKSTLLLEIISFLIYYE